MVPSDMTSRPSEAGSPNLDFLRAYAVLTVYFGHLLQTFHIEHIWGNLTIYDFAQTGVVIFFVHTSLVLMLSMERLHLSYGKMSIVFYIRRAFRIYPLSIVTVLLMLALRAPGFPTDHYFWQGSGVLFSNLALVQNITGSPSFPAVLWSLPYEVQMYLVLPVLFVLLRRFTSWWVPVCLWLFAVSAIIAMWKMRVRGDIPLLLEYTPCFLGGLIGYRLWRQPYFRFDFWAWPVAITLCVALRVFAGLVTVPRSTMLSAWIACLFLGLAIPQFVELRDGLARRLAGAIAKYSYGIYLSHSLVFWIAFILLRGSNSLLQSGICIALSIFLPVAMYRGIEKPMINLGVRLAGGSVRQEPKFASLEKVA
jgi:peptidoglycan/LPS O-acetylase OafA/YrhL